MSHSRKVLRTFEFLELLRKSKQSLRAAEKSHKKVEAKSTGFSAEFFGSQSVLSRNILFCQENKNSNFDNFFPELVKNPPTSS